MAATAILNFKNVNLWSSDCNLVHQSVSNYIKIAILNMNFVIRDHPRSQLCGSITTPKFGIDPIFPAGDITIL